MKYVGIVNIKGQVYDYLLMQDPLDAGHWHNMIENERKEEE